MHLPGSQNHVTGLGGAAIGRELSANTDGRSHVIQHKSDTGKIFRQCHQLIQLMMEKPGIKTQIVLFQQRQAPTPVMITGKIGARAETHDAVIQIKRQHLSHTAKPCAGLYMGRNQLGGVGLLQPHITHHRPQARGTVAKKLLQPTGFLGRPQTLAITPFRFNVHNLGNGQVGGIGCVIRR